MGGHSQDGRVPRSSVLQSVAEFAQKRKVYHMSVCDTASMTSDDSVDLSCLPCDVPIMQHAEACWLEQDSFILSTRRSSSLVMSSSTGASSDPPRRSSAPPPRSSGAPRRSSDPPRRAVPSFLEGDAPEPQFNFRRMDYYLASRQGMEPVEHIMARNIDYISQLPPDCMDWIPQLDTPGEELEIYLSDMSLAQAYYFRMGQVDNDPTWRTEWLKSCFDGQFDGPVTPEMWAERRTPKSDSVLF